MSSRMNRAGGRGGVSAPKSDRRTRRGRGRAASALHLPRALVFDSGLGGLSVLAEIRRLQAGRRNRLRRHDDAAFPYGRLSEAALVAPGQDRDGPTLIGETEPGYRRHRLQHRLHPGFASRSRAALSAPAVRRSTVPGDQAGGGGVAVGIDPASWRRAAPWRAITPMIWCAITPPIARSTLVGSPLLAVIAAERVMRGEAIDEGENRARDRAVFRRTRTRRRTDQIVLGCTHFPLIVDRLKRHFAVGGRLRRPRAGDRAPPRCADRRDAFGRVDSR